MEEVNKLEKEVMKLFHCGSKLAKELEKKLRDKGYDFKVITTGFEKPILSYGCIRRYGYPQVWSFINCSL